MAKKTPEPQPEKAPDKPMGIREKLRAIAQGVSSKIVPVPEWGDGNEIEVRRLTIAMQAVWKALAVDPTSQESDDANEDDPQLPRIKIGELSELNIAALLVSCCFNPDTGERVFESEDVTTLMGLPPEHRPVISRLLAAAVDLNAFGQKIVEEAVKNSDSSPTSEPSSASGSNQESLPPS